MIVKILFFGQLADLAGTSEIIIDQVNDTDALIIKLQQQFPLLGESKYIIAVNNKAISTNTALNNNSIVALLPPFSGG